MGSFGVRYSARAWRKSASIGSLVLNRTNGSHNRHSRVMTEQISVCNGIMLQPRLHNSSRLPTNSVSYLHNSSVHRRTVRLYKASDNRSYECKRSFLTVLKMGWWCVCSFCFLSFYFHTCRNIRVLLIPDIGIKFIVLYFILNAGERFRF